MKKKMKKRTILEKPYESDKECYNETPIGDTKPSIKNNPIKKEEKEQKNEKEPKNENEVNNENKKKKILKKNMYQ